MKTTNTKYKLVNRQSNSLYQIQALKNFSDVKIGDLGRFIEKEDNLLIHGNAWV